MVCRQPRLATGGKRPVTVVALVWLSASDDAKIVKLPLDVRVMLVSHSFGR